MLSEPHIELGIIEASATRESLYLMCDRAVVS